MTLDEACDVVGRKLQSEYPGHQWFVGSSDGTVLVIRNLSLSSKQCWAVPLKGKLSKVEGHELEREAVMGGGELLERYHVSRSPLIGPQQAVQILRQRGAKEARFDK